MKHLSKLFILFFILISSQSYSFNNLITGDKSDIQDINETFFCVYNKTLKLTRFHTDWTKEETERFIDNNIMFFDYPTMFKLKINTSKNIARTIITDKWTDKNKKKHTEITEKVYLVTFFNGTLINLIYDKNFPRFKNNVSKTPYDKKIYSYMNKITLNLEDLVFVENNMVHREKDNEIDITTGSCEKI